jgi:hypothetical protein
MSSYFANKHYNIAWLENELEYLLDNPELSDETKEQIQRTIDQLELMFIKLEDLDKVMTFRMTEDQFIDKYKKIRI